MQSFLYIIGVIAVGYFAKSKGRSPIFWGLLAFFLTPFIIGIILFFMKNLNTGRYDGDTIDTTARPIPDETPRHQPDLINPPSKKSKEDIDESIRRMEKKLAQGTSSDEEIAPVVTYGTAASSVLEKELPVAKDEPTDITQFEIVEDVSDGHKNEVVDNYGVPGNVCCESCGQPLTAGAKFCTNCGAPVAK